MKDYQEKNEGTTANVPSADPSLGTILYTNQDSMQGIAWIGFADADLTDLRDSVPEIEDAPSDSVTVTGPGEADISSGTDAVVVMAGTVVMTGRLSEDEREQEREESLAPEELPPEPVTVTGPVPNRLDAPIPICIARQAEKKRRVIFVAVGGPSGVGKSTLVARLCELYDSRCKQINRSRALGMMKNIPRYEDLIAQQARPEVLDDCKLGEGQVLDCLGQTHCFQVPEAVQEKKSTQT